MDVAAGATAASPVSLDWNQAHRASLYGALCRHSGKPGSIAKLVVKGFPTGQVAHFLRLLPCQGRRTSTAAHVHFDRREHHVHGVTAGAHELPGGSLRARHGAHRQQRSRLDLWDYYQVCTFTSSATSIRSGAAIRLSGHVPGGGYATLYKRTTAAGQPATTAATGWTRVGTVRITSTGKFITGYLHPTRSTWYVARYTGSKLKVTAFTSVVKVSVR